MKTFTKVIPTIAIAALIALALHTPAKADTVNIPKDKATLVVTTVLGKNVSTNFLTFVNKHEAEEFENTLLISNPATNVLRPGKNPVYFVTEIFH